MLTGFVFLGLQVSFKVILTAKNTVLFFFFSFHLGDFSSTRSLLSVKSLLEVDMLSLHVV